MDDATIVYEDVKADFFTSSSKDKKSQSNKGSPKKIQKKPPQKQKKTKGFKLEYNAPVSLSFCLITFLAFAFLKYFAKADFLLFSCPTKQGTALAFSAINPLHYIRLFTYALGYLDLSHLLFSSIIVLILGTSLESTYGSKLFLVMILVSIFATGILGSCFSSVSLQGYSSVIFMISILSTYAAIEKKKIPLTLLLTCFVFVFYEISFFVTSKNSPLPVLFYFIGSLFGCVFGFLATPANKR